MIDNFDRFDMYEAEQRRQERMRDAEEYEFLIADREEDEYKEMKR